MITALPPISIILEVPTDGKASCLDHLIEVLTVHLVHRTTALGKTALDMLLFLRALDLECSRLYHVLFGEYEVTYYLILRHLVVCLMHLVIEICLYLGIVRLGLKSELRTDSLAVDKELGADIDRVAVIPVAPYKRFRDTLYLRKNSFYLLRESLLSVCENDHGLNSSGNVDRAALVDISHISRMEPTVIVKDLSGRLLVLEIAEHYAVRLGKDLADSFRALAFSVDCNRNTGKRTADGTVNITCFVIYRNNR